MGYTNSSWRGDDEDRKFITGYVFMLGCASVAWNSRKEQIVALSSREDEYITDSLCACQATWMVNLINEISGEDYGSMIMKTDNMFVRFQEKTTGQ